MSSARDAVPAPPGATLGGYAAELLARMARLDDAASSVRALAAEMQADADRLREAYAYVLSLGDDAET